MPRLTGAAIAYLALAACYRPELTSCKVACAAPTDCAGDQHCSEGWCVARGTTCDEDGQTVTIDARDPDAGADGRPDPCTQGCSNGTCQDGVCVIDCSGDDACPDDVACPANLPCRVICGNRACGHKINCTLASSCDVHCLGAAACNDEIQCGASECTVTCSGAGSCRRRTKCANACACDVTCSGLDSCGEPSECPAPACRVGNGCTSTLGGCNDCDDG